MTSEVRGFGGGAGPGLIKTHCPDDELMAFVSAAAHTIILTMRDPLDCVSSFMSQFGAPFDFVLDRVAASAQRALVWNDSFQVSVFRYEDAFFDRISTIANLSDLLGLDCTIGGAIEIFGGLRKKAVKAKIDDLVAGGVLNPAQPIDSYDLRTHWHPNHVGDGLIGKYRFHLSADQIDEVIGRNERFYATFYGEYARAAPDPRAASPRLAARG